MQGKPFHSSLIEYMMSGPVVAVALQGPRVIESLRALMGKTNPVLAAVGTIRGDLAVTAERNLIHGSDAPTSAARELALWFGPTELVEWTPAQAKWLFE
jgi:nucleoside-diphosphate kinase